MSDVDQFINNARALADEAVANLRPGNLISSVQEPAVRSQLEALKAQIAATEALVQMVKRLEEVAIPPRMIQLSPLTPERTAKLMEDI
jgi:hypothetical protein